ncbi:hypothetical protein OPU39_08400, partial [Acinetobacter nosocomialis]|nr:hypothetical protein [Acinetobacter nosocomialis]
MTKLSAALLLSSSLVGCAAMVKTPYQAPSVQVPGSFQYDTTKTKTASFQLRKRPMRRYRNYRA